MSDQNPETGRPRNYPLVVVKNDDMMPERKSRSIFSRIFFALLIFLAGLGSGYLMWGQSGTQISAQGANPKPSDAIDMNAMRQAIMPEEGITLNVKYGDIGPQLLSAGAFDLKNFISLYEQNGEPLSARDTKILSQSSQQQVVISSQNAHFALNLFWALGLVNQNPILDSGAIQKQSGGKIDQYASTGGWTIGQKPVTALFSSAKILVLSPEQQARVEEAAKAVYRPCCDNPTDFPDCNHGMAMLGLLELMASQNATLDEMLAAAKQVNAFWFPQQALEQAVYFKATQSQDYAAVDARLVLGARYSSGSGFRQMHQWLTNNGLLPQAPNSGNGCGV